MKSGKNDVSFKFSSFFYRKVLQIQKKTLTFAPAIKKYRADSSGIARYLKYG